VLGANFVLPSASPALEAGSAAADPSLQYRALCDGRPFSYCGAAPDLGAYERTTLSR
jgi:hypothetical protein